MIEVDLRNLSFKLALEILQWCCDQGFQGPIVNVINCDGKFDPSVYIFELTEQEAIWFALRWA